MPVETQSRYAVAPRKDKLHSAVDFVKKYPFILLVTLASFVFTLLSFQYVDTVSETSWTLNIWDALFSGRLLEYSDVTFENLRGAPCDRDTGGFMTLLPWAFWNFPLWLAFPNPETYDPNNHLCLLWSRLFLILSLFLVSYYVKKLSYWVTENNAASDYGFLLCMTAGSALLSVGYAGQNEILYVLSFIASIYAHLKGHDVTSVCLMIYSLGCFPALIVPLLIIMFTNNRGTVRSIIIAGVQLIIGMAIFGLGSSSSGGYGSISTWIDSFFMTRAVLLSDARGISLFMVCTVLILICCIFKERKNEVHEAIIYTALFFISMLLCSWLVFYRIFICIPPVIIAMMLLYDEKDSKLFKIGLVMFTALNYVSCFFALQADYCWSYSSFQGILSQYLSFDCTGNFLWMLFGDLVNPISILLTSAMFVSCGFLILLVFKKPIGYRDVNVSMENLLLINAACPLFLILGFLLVPMI